MKLLVVTAIREDRDDIDIIFDKHGVKAYSSTDIRGIRNDTGEADEADNWFGTDNKIPFNSVMLFSFTTEAIAKEVLQSIQAINEDGRTFPIRAFTLRVEEHV